MGSGFKTWSTGDVLTAADVNGYLMQQTVITCTSGTRPSSPATGMVIYETDTTKYQKWNGSSWRPFASARTSYTPVLTATTTNPTLGTGSTANGWYTYGSEMVTYTFFLKFGTSPSAGSGNYLVSLPVTSATPFGSTLHPAVGTIQIADFSANNYAAGSCFVDASTGANVGLISGAIVGAAVPWTWAASDYISGTITYPV